MGKIFISYRRDDSADTVGRMYDRLVLHFGREAIFKDVDSIPFGANFARYIGDVVKQCSVLLAVIGPRSVDESNATGLRRLDDPGDFVRLEIETALRQSIVVIPVLVQGARVPTPDQLPESLRELPLLNATAVRRDPDFDTDTRRLVTALEKLVPPTQSPAAAQPIYQAPPPARAAGTPALQRGQTSRKLLGSVLALVGVVLLALAAVVHYVGGVYVIPHQSTYLAVLGLLALLSGAWLALRR